MRRITNEELREPDVDHIVPDGLVLPREVRLYLEGCVGRRVTNSVTGQTGTKYRIPAYLMREWLVQQ